MAHVQRPGRIGRDELDQHALAGRRAAAERRAGGQHLAHHLLLGGGLQAHVEEAGTGDVDGLDPAFEDRRRAQGGGDVLGQLARLASERLGQLHGGRAGEVAMRGDLGGFEDGPGAGAGREGFERARERGEQLLFDQ